MNRIARCIVIGFTALATLAAADTAPAPNEDGKPFLDAMNALGGLVANGGPAANGANSNAEPAGQDLTEPAAQAEGKDAAPAVKKHRSLEKTMILISAGAAAGAAIGASTGKGSKGAMIGAAVGGAAGLIYDRMTYKDPGKI